MLPDVCAHYYIFLLHLCTYYIFFTAPYAYCRVLSDCSHWQIGHVGHAGHAHAYAFAHCHY